MKTRLGKISLAVLFTLVILLLAAHLILRPAYATKVSSADDSTAIAVVDTVVDTIAILNSDELALLGAGGNVWYVDSGATGSGTAADWTNADITIELALVHAAANNGDYIVCAAYHAETASTGTFDLAKDGVTVIGLGKGDAMTTITYDGTADTCIMGATGDGCTIRNIKFYTATDDIVSAIVVEDGCTDFIIEDCVFEATTTDEFIDAIKIHGTAANSGIVRNNRFLGDKASNSAPKASINFEDAHFLQIYGNEFSGDIGDAHIFNETTASNFVTIRDNRILCGFIGADSTNLDTTPGISLVATTTGWIQDNFVVTNVATPDLAIVAADCYLSGNTYNELQGAAFAAQEIGLVPGRSYALTMNMAAAHNADLFAVAGGPILITSLTFYCTTDVASTNTWTIICDHADKDIEFTDAVDVAAANDGDRIVFSAANPAVVTILALTAEVGSGNPMVPWYCPIGMIEVTNDDSTQVGVFDVYMTFIPLTNGVTVTPQ